MDFIYKLPPLVLVINCLSSGALLMRLLHDFVSFVGTCKRGLMKSVIISFNENRVVLSKVSITKSKISSVAARVSMIYVGYSNISVSMSKASVYLLIPESI
jgi:hypothetical protein